MAKSVVQRNNGGPKGYGQPEKKAMRSALMRPEDEAVFGLPPDEGEMRLTGQEEAPSVYPAQPQYRSQPKSPYGLKDEGVSTGATAAGITMLADSDASFTKAIGMEFSVPPIGFFDRSKRYAIYVVDGVIKVSHHTSGADACEIAGGEAMLAAI